jgi:hypothetical protein
MRPRLRWTETELRAHDEDTSVVWRLACTIVLGALRKNATIIFVKKTAAAKLAVLYAIDGSLVEEMAPPAQHHVALVVQMMTLCGPLDVQPGARGEFDIVRDDRTLLVAHAICGANEWGLTATLRLGPPPRVLN